MPHLSSMPQDEASQAGLVLVQSGAVRAGQERAYPLNKLKASPDNVRKSGHSAAAIEARAASILANGLIQPPVVRPERRADGGETGYALVTAGEGRRLALRLLAKRRIIPKTVLVRCLVEGALERRNHWEKTSHSLLVGVILHVLYAEADKTLAGVANFLADPSRPIETTLRAMMNTRHLGDRVHPVVASAARELLNKSDNERSGVLSTAMSFLGLYRDPVVAAVTSRCDWRIADLVEADKPVSLYLVVPPSDINRTKPLIRLILNQIGRRLTEGLEAARTRRALLLMLDEFPALGRLDFFEASLAFMAGYRVKAFLIAQSLNQIEKAYGPNHAILDNCHVRVVFATNDERTARRVSDSLGTATEMRAMKNYAGHRLSPWLGHLMVSRQETARALLTPGEVMQLPAHQAIVMTAGAPPVRAQKIRYYADPELAARVVKFDGAGGLPERVDPAVWTGRLSADAAIRKGRKGSSDEGGLKREPDLFDAEEEAPKLEEEISPERDGDSDEVLQAGALQRRFAGVARQVAMDSDDGIPLGDDAC